MDADVRGHGPLDQIHNALPNPGSLAVSGNVETVAIFILMLIILALG